MNFGRNLPILPYLASFCPNRAGRGGAHNSQNCIKTAKVSSDTRLIWTFFRIPQKIDTARFRWPKTRLKNRKNLAGKHCKSHVACAYPTEVYRKNTHKNPAFWRYRSRMDDKWLKNQKKTIRKKKSTETGGAQDGCVKPTEKNTNILSETCCMTFFFWARIIAPSCFTFFFQYWLCSFPSVFFGFQLLKGSEAKSVAEELC